MDILSESGIIYKKWICSQPRAVLLLVHGLGGFSGRWDFLAEFFIQQGISSYAIELKGFGATKDLKGHVDSFDTYFNDIRFIYDIIKKEHGEKKIFLIGESMGGLIVFLLAGLKPDLFDGVICISPVFKSKFKFTLIEYIKLFVFLIFFPKKQLKMPFDSAMCTRDMSYQKAMNNETKEHRLATISLLWNIFSGQMKLNFIKNKIKIPVLFLTAGDFDKIVDVEAVKLVFKSMLLSDKEFIQYNDMVHALSIDCGREKVFADILKWVNERCL